jgi:integral membrane sensor domain MASE1
MFAKIQRRSATITGVLDTVIGTLLCVSAAALLAGLFASSSIRLALPLICLAVVLAAAARFGVTTGILGSVFSAMLLAYFVFSPQNSLRIADSTARNNIGWLLVGGISLSFLFAPSPAEAHRSRDRQHPPESQE